MLGQCSCSGTQLQSCVLLPHISPCRALVSGEPVSGAALSSDMRMFNSVGDMRTELEEG